MQQRLCGLDIDGVLNNYPQCWIDFVNTTIGTNFVNLNDMKQSLSYARYKVLKHIYRSSGYKESLPVRAGAKEFIQSLYSCGYKAILVTSRPFDKYPELRMQTKRWLDKNNYMYDDLIYSNKKHLEIITQYPTIGFVVEDNRAFANDIATCGYRVYLINNEYNKGEVNRNVERVNTFDEILFLEGLNKWELI